MAYGVIMGQTPILNASGVTYDNSQTSNIITANNVQQAIDESAKKIESVQSSGAQWELIYEQNFNVDRVDIPVKEKETLYLCKPNFSLETINKYALIFAHCNYEYTAVDVRNDISMYVDEIFMRRLPTSMSSITYNYSNDSFCAIKTRSNYGNKDDNIFMSATRGYMWNGTLYVEGNSNVDIKVRFHGTYKIYGLKAPI